MPLDNLPFAALFFMFISSINVIDVSFPAYYHRPDYYILIFRDFLFRNVGFCKLYLENYFYKLSVYPSNNLFITSGSFLILQLTLKRGHTIIKRLRNFRKFYERAC